MNCPFCHFPLSYDQVWSIGNTYWRVRCSQERCSNTDYQERLFLGFADNFPDKEITDYSLFIPVDDLYYTFTSIESTVNKSPNHYSSIEYLKKPYEDPVMLYEWAEWVPLQENLDVYIEKIRRLVNLKAFW